MRGMNIPERFTATVYVSAYSDPASPLYGMISVHDFDPTDCDGRILLGQTDVDIPLDIKGTTDKQIAQLRKSKQRIIDQATEQANQIDEAIESLLAIEHEVTP